MNVEEERALLRRFEPVIRYTRGEKFFPTDVDSYVRHCSLWVQRRNQQPECLVPDGELTLDEIVKPRPEGFETVTYLQFIEPLDIRKMAEYEILSRFAEKDEKNIFRAGFGRLARVGYISRFIDAAFSLSLLARGRITGDRATAAVIAYQNLLEKNERYCYYGRVIRQSGWIVLQYWFFYVFNNWRSEFFGVNDHEADWEMINVYLYADANGQIYPEWVAYANHDFNGDDLRRRWDDPELEKVGEHPVIYAGAGSHASYFSRGEYLTQMEIPFLVPLARFIEHLQVAWMNLSGYKQPLQSQSSWNVFHVPFVDYARGDGLSIGAGQEKEWDEVCLIEPPPVWVEEYRGLWGYYARDPIAGEDAPAGPRYNRDGSVRRVWYDPLGWAGLDKVPPPSQMQEVMRRRSQELYEERQVLLRTMTEKETHLENLGVEMAAMRGQSHWKTLHKEYQIQVNALSTEIDSLRNRLTVCETLEKNLASYAHTLAGGSREPARAHIRHAHCAEGCDTGKYSRAVEFWAAISIGLMLIAFVAILLFARHYFFIGLVGIISFAVFIESSFRGQLVRFVNSVAIGLAVVSMLVLFYNFFWQIIVLAVLLAGGYMLWENLQELWT